MHIYSSHLGYLYVSDIEIDNEELYCETCGESDRYVGWAPNRIAAWKTLMDYTDVYSEYLCINCPHETDCYCGDRCMKTHQNGGYDYNYVWDFILQHWS